MNWLFIVVLAIILFGAIYGVRKGFLRLLFSLIAVVVLMGLMAYITPYVSTYIQEHTQIGTVISEHITEKLQESAEAAVDNAAANQEQSLEDAGILLPDVLKDLVFEKGTQAAQDALIESGVYEQLAAQLTDMVLMVMAYAIALIIALIIVFIIGKLTDLANKAPVIKGPNRVIGFFAGGFLGLVAVWILFMIIGVMSGSDLGKLAMAQIQANPFLEALYNDNLLLKLVVEFKR